MQLKDRIRRLVLRDYGVSVDAVQQALRRKRVKVSTLTVAGIMSDFKSTLRFLEQEGLIEIGKHSKRRRSNQSHDLDLKEKPRSRKYPYRGYRPWWRETE
jgi:hypothetical protein